MLAESTTTRRERLKPIIVAAITEAIQNRARAGLIEFAQYVDPNQQRNYQARHLRYLALFVERIIATPNGRGVITMPPRHWKSSTVSEKLPAWYLGKHPDQSLILASYGAGLPERFSRNIRSTLEDNARYRSLFPEVQLRKDSRDVSDWSLKGAYRSSLRSVGVGGGVTGGGANGIIIDDPIKDWAEAQSQIVKDGTWDWLTKTVYTRLEPGGWILLITTRWAEDDPAGRLLKAERDVGGEHYEVLNLPALAGKDDPLGRPEGVALWRARYDEAALARIRVVLGEAAFQIIYQGIAVLLEGNVIKRSWFEYVPNLPIGAEWRVRAWDCAFTEKQTHKDDPDFTATVKSTVHEQVMYLGSPRLFRASLENLSEELVKAKKQELPIRYGMGKVAVKASIVKALNAAGFSIEGYDESVDALARAGGWTPLASMGRVKLVGMAEEWQSFMDQLIAFPNGAHDDAVDAISGCAEMQGFIFNPMAMVAQQQSLRAQLHALHETPSDGRWMGERPPVGAG